MVGAVRHPLNAGFSSFLLQAQNSKAQILDLAVEGGYTDFGKESQTMGGQNTQFKLNGYNAAGLLIFLSDIHSLGLKNTEGLLHTTSWYWDLNDDTRKFAKRFFDKTKRMPTDIQAADYSATTTYLKAVEAARPPTDKVMAQLKHEDRRLLMPRAGFVKTAAWCTTCTWCRSSRRSGIDQPWTT